MTQISLLIGIFILNFEIIIIMIKPMYRILDFFFLIMDTIKHDHDINENDRMDESLPVGLHLYLIDETT